MFGSYRRRCSVIDRIGKKIVGNRKRQHGIISGEELYKNRLRKSVFIILSLVCAFSINILCIFLNLKYGFSLQKVSIIMQVLLTVVFIAGIILLPYHPCHYGLNCNNLKRNIVTGISAGSAFLAVVILIRYNLFRSGYHHFGFCLSLTLTSFLYPVIVVIQETIIKGFFQSYFIVVMEKYRFSRFFAVFIASYIFAQFHILYSIPFFLMTFGFAFITGWIYERHRSIVGVSIIHFMAGGGFLFFSNM